MNIVERSSGYWVVDNDGVIEGPFDTIEEAQNYIDKEAVVVLNTFTGQDSMYTVEKRMTKEQAIIKILKVLKSPMMVMSVYTRDEALTIAEEYGITAKDLIEVWSNIAMKV